MHLVGLEFSGRWLPSVLLVTFKIFYFSLHIASLIIIYFIHVAVKFKKKKAGVITWFLP
jgi:hypothetical protein